MKSRCRHRGYCYRNDLIVCVYWFIYNVCFQECLRLIIIIIHIPVYSDRNALYNYVMYVSCNAHAIY